MLQLSNLVNCFADAMEKNSKYVGVLVRSVDHPMEDIIISRRDSFTCKLNHYIRDYRQDLKSKDETSEVVSFGCADSIPELVGKLL